jgi:hypothetical protein
MRITFTTSTRKEPAELPNDGRTELGRSPGLFIPRVVRVDTGVLVF